MYIPKGTVWCDVVVTNGCDVVEECIVVCVGNIDGDSVVDFGVVIVLILDFVTGVLTLVRDTDTVCVVEVKAADVIEDMMIPVGGLVVVVIVENLRVLVGKGSCVVDIVLFAEVVVCLPQSTFLGQSHMLMLVFQ